MADEVKTEARSDRFSTNTLRKNNEEVLRKKFQLQSSHQCKDFMNGFLSFTYICYAGLRLSLIEFGACAQANGLWVVFACRQQNKRMNECMDRVYNEETFKAYVEDKGHSLQPPRNLIDSLRGTNN